MSKSVASGHGQGALGLFLALAVLSGTACSPTNGEFERPELRIDNLVLVTIDTLRADHVGAIGYHRPTTPNLDRLARRSALFTQAIAQSSWTRASVASYMTGLYPTTLGLTCHNFRVPKAETTTASPLASKMLTGQSVM